MFAERLKELRKAKGLTQIKFASDFHVANGTIAMWETGRREPDFETTQRIADYFGVSVDYLLGREDKKEAPTPKDERSITFDDFTYAMHNETKNLSQEKKDMLLQMARFFNEELEKEKGET